MIVGSLAVTLQIPSSHSLKEKRMVVKSLLTRARQDFHVAVAEVGDTERWQIAELGFAAVSETAHQVDAILRTVLEFIERSRPDLPILAADFDSFAPNS